MGRYQYDVAVIGGGAAGLTASGLAASLGARTVLVEAHRLGGDCTWTGCVPSKALLKAARQLHAMRTADRFGLPSCHEPIDFESVMRRVRAVRQNIYAGADAPEVVAGRGIDVVAGRAAFIDKHTVIVESKDEAPKRISSRYFVICTGSSPVRLEVPGVGPEHLLTNETLFELEKLPEKFLIVGAGPVGVEMGQAFSRLGSRVTIVERGDRLLPADEPECSEIVRKALEADGVALILNGEIENAEPSGDGYSVQISTGDTWQSVSCDALLLAIGRRPNVQDLNLKNAGVEFDGTGIRINHSCQTTADSIYACGDVAQGPNFTHIADNMAKTAVARILLKVPASYEREAVPSVTFTDPESAHLGQTSQQLEANGRRFKTIRLPYDRIDRALIEGESDGVVVANVSPISGRILGAHIAGSGAGEMIHEFALAMKNNLTLKDISATVHAYPSRSLGVRRTADQWYVRQGSPKLLKIVGTVFGFRGEVSGSIGTDDVV